MSPVHRLWHWIARVLLGLAGLGLIVDGALHWILYGRSGLAAIKASSLPEVLRSDFATFWVADVVTLWAAGIILAWTALRPTAASAFIVFVVSAIPAGLGIFNVLHNGMWIASFNMLAAASLGVVGALVKAYVDRQARLQAPQATDAA
jgi:hypothetical protein